MGDMLRNRVAVITVSGNGLGRAEAIAMVPQWAKVVGMIRGQIMTA